METTTRFRTRHSEAWAAGRRSCQLVCRCPGSVRFGRADVSHTDADTSSGLDALIGNTPQLRSQDTLRVDLERLGVTAGEVLVLHCSLSAIGWVCGGASAVIGAVMDVLGPSGTLVMPAQSSDLTDPAGWSAPPVPEAWWADIRGTMPPYDPRTTPTRGMGIVAEQFRTWPGVLRSAHPVFSFAAHGPAAATVVARQPLADPFGEDSPLARFHALDARILLLGVGFNRCTALHLAERRAWPDRPHVEHGSPMLVDGERRWARYGIPAMDDGRFAAVGQATVGAAGHQRGSVGSAFCHLVHLRGIVDEAVRLWRENPA